MKKLSIIFISIAGIMSLYSCKKDETKVVLTDFTAAQVQIPASETNFVLLKENKDSLLTTFTWSAATYKPTDLSKPIYTLQYDTVGGTFASFKVLKSTTDLTFPITVSAMNKLLLDAKGQPGKFAIYQYRIKASLTEGTASEDKYSTVITLGYTPYSTAVADTAKLILSLTPSQTIFSMESDGIYTGMVKLPGGTSFTLTDSATNKVYGGAGGTLSENGTAISVADSGWYNMTVNTVALTYSIDPYMIGVVGSATPNSWNAPDSKMDYIAKTGKWAITMDLQPSLDGGVLKCEFKFRLNDAWAWNMGGTEASLTHNGPNIVVAVPGIYTITLTITDPTLGIETGTFTMVPVK